MTANDKRTLAGWLALAALALAVVVLTYDLPDRALLALALAGFFAALATVGGFFTLQGVRYARRYHGRQPGELDTATLPALRRGGDAATRRDRRHLRRAMRGLS